MDTKPASAMTIGALARAAGVGIDTVRFYEREGLLPPPTRRASGYREYTPATASRLRFIGCSAGYCAYRSVGRLRFGVLQYASLTPP